MKTNLNTVEIKSLIEVGKMTGHYTYMRQQGMQNPIRIVHAATIAKGVRVKTINGDWREVNMACEFYNA